MADFGPGCSAGQLATNGEQGPDTRKWTSDPSEHSQGKGGHFLGRECLVAGPLPGTWPETSGGLPPVESVHCSWLRGEKLGCSFQRVRHAVHRSELESLERLAPQACAKVAGE